MFTNNEEMVVGAVSTAMIGFSGLALRKIAAKAAPTMVLALAAVVVPAALFVTPQAALADDECGLQVGTTPVECDQSSYGSGVTYDAVGDLFIEFTNPTVSNIGGAGVTLSGDGSESIDFDSATTATELDSAGATAALLGVTTIDGDIVIATEEMDADFAPTTHGIFAESTGTGTIDITTTGNVDAQSNTNPVDSIGIEALTDSGNIALTTGASVLGNEGAIRAVSGSGNISIETNGGLGISSIDTQQYGIQAETGGAGTLTITVSDQIQIGNGSTGAAIDATTGTGDLIIDLISIGSLSRVYGGDGTAIRTDAGGDVLIDVGDGRLVLADTAMDLTAVGQTTVNNNGGRITGGSSLGEFAIRAAGGSLILTNTDGSSDGIRGALDFSNLTGGYTFNNNGTWNIRTGTPTGNPNPQRLSVLGAGTFNNAGTIDFGDRESVVQAPGTTFNGLAGSLFEMGMTLSSEGQSSCDAATVAACLDLTGGETSGQTEILVTSSAPPLDPEGGLTNAANPGVLLVDVSGGTSAAEHFVLHPDSENYLDTSFYGPIINPGAGPVVYTLLYNPNTQQHILSTVPTEEGAEYATFIDETVSIWHTTADAVVGRQADLRGGATGGGWVRLVNERTTRDTTLSMTTHGNSFTFDMGYEQDTRAALFGFDALNRDNFVIGLHGGLISSETDYDGTGNGNEAKGAAAGIYGGWWRDLGIGQLTVDATVNGNFLTLDHDASYEVTHSDIRSLGIRAEAGWKVPVIDGFYVQPLATVAYVSSNIETMELRQNDISFEDAESQRAALGVRLGGHFEAQSGIAARYWLTGRAWDERAEDGRVEYATTGEPLVIADDISGSFEEVGFGASLSNKEDTLSVFASGSTKFIDDVTNYNVSVGGRLRW